MNKITIDELLVKNALVDDFQNLIHENTYVNKNIFDICNELIYSNSKINKFVSKTCKYCGCIDINNKDGKNEICSNCKEELEKEIGNHLYHLTALCNALNLNLYDSILKEYNVIKILGKYYVN